MDTLLQSTPLILLAMIFVMAVLYSSVGHGGASGYLAAMALFGMSPLLMKPAALSMNIVVAAWVLSRLNQQGYFDRKLFIPIAAASIPMAYLGGMITLDAELYQLIVGVALLLAAFHFVFRTQSHDDCLSPHLGLALLIGGLLGFFSGLTGVGGGIYLSPLLLALRWTTMRTNAAIAAAFILVNSIAGLAGFASTGQPWPSGIVVMAVVALVGALIGAELAAKYYSSKVMVKVLGVVLLIAGIKMIVTA